MTNLSTRKKSDCDIWICVIGLQSQFTFRFTEQVGTAVEHFNYNGMYTDRFSTWLPQAYYGFPQCLQLNARMVD
jgi:hypothetical protein